MSNIAIQRDPNKAAPAPLSRREPWDPFATMRELMRWEPLRDLAPLQWLEPGGMASYTPAFEVKETKDAFEFKADVPGVDSKDIDVKLTDNRLTVSGKREAEKSEKGETYYSYERSFGSFSRSFTIPEGANADAVRADLKDGVLKIVLPKKPEAKPRQVTVKAG